MKQHLLSLLLKRTSEQTNQKAQSQNNVSLKYFELLVEWDGESNEKVGNLCTNKLYLMHKEDGKEIEEIVDLRNYLIIRNKNHR